MWQGSWHHSKHYSSSKAVEHAGLVLRSHAISHNEDTSLASDEAGCRVRVTRARGDDGLELWELATSDLPSFAYMYRLIRTSVGRQGIIRNIW